MSTPILTQDRLTERGFKTTVVICPKCRDKWEETDGKATTCAHCNVTPIWWPEFSKTVKAAEIDMMPPAILAAYLRVLIVAYRHEDRPTIANFLEERLALLEVSLHGIQTSSPS